MGGGLFTTLFEAVDRGFGGLSYRLPLLVRARLEVDTRGDVRGALSKEFQVTDRLKWMLAGRYDTGSHWEGRTGLEYLLTKSISLDAEVRTDHGIGAGLTIRF